MMGSSMATPSLALYAGEFSGGNELLIGAVIAGFAIGRLIFDIPAGFLTDRLGVSVTMALGLAVLVGSSLIAATAPDFWILLSARIVEGIGSAIYVGAAISFVLLASDSSRRGMTMGTYQSILMAGPIVGPAAGAPIAAYFGLNAPYFAFAAMMAASLVVVFLLTRRGMLSMRNGDSEQQSTGKGTAGTISLYLNTAGIATFGFAFLRSGIYSTGMPLFAYGGLSLSLFDVGGILTAASLANLGASYFSGRLTTIYGMRKPLFVAIMLSAVLVAVIPISSSALQLLLIMMLIGVSSGFFGQSIAWAAEQIEAKAKLLEDSADSYNALGIQSHLTRGIGINRMIGDMGLIIGPIFVGYVVLLLSKEPVVWLVSFGTSSLFLGLSSLAILRPSNARTSRPEDAKKL
jgi:MFS family permease